jgi:hypothetical protein
LPVKDCAKAFSDKFAAHVNHIWMGIKRFR